MTGHAATGTRAWLIRGILVFSVLMVGAAVASGAEPTIVRVEEDWELVVATPDPDSDAPQVTTILSPVGHVQSIHAAMVLNHQGLPSFEPGGLQLQLWEGEVPCADRMFPNGAILSQPNERISWTQCVELKDGGLLFEIVRGSSSTWGSFGGQGYLKMSTPTELASLNAYDPAVSVVNSGVGYAGNRVASLTLKAVRLITSEGEQLDDTTPRVAHPQQ
jgi:hypothetical protein